MKTVEELYNHIVSQMTPEEALKKLLATTVEEYQHITVDKEYEEKGGSALGIIEMCSLELGWNIAIPSGEGEKIQGLIIGTEEYISSILGDLEEVEIEAQEIED